MSKVPFEQAVIDAAKHDPRYALEAYHFLRDALDTTMKSMEKGRKDANYHVSGAELCEGVREYALQQFGPMVPTIFDAWNIRTTRDIGEMVFNLIHTGAFSSSDSDRVEDFEEVFRFEDVFEKPFLPGRGMAPTPSRRRR